MCRRGVRPYGVPGAGAMTGAPRDKYASRDFIVLHLALVDEVGLEAALLFQRIAWRCEGEGGSWEATLDDLQEETRLSRHKVHRAVAVLRDAGWIDSDRADRFRPVLTWRIRWDDGASDEVENHASSQVAAVNQDSGITWSGNPEHPENPKIGITTTPKDGSKKTPPAAREGEPAEALFAVPDPPPEEPPAGPPKTAQTLVARWCDGYRATHAGDDAPKAYMGRVAGQARNLAKACGDDHEEWVGAYHAAYGAGQAAAWDITRYLVPQQQRQSAARRNVFADPSLGGPGAETMATFSSYLTGGPRAIGGDQ